MESEGVMQKNVMNDTISSVMRASVGMEVNGGMRESGSK